MNDRWEQSTVGDPLWPLLEAICEGTLDPAQQRQLEELVLHDEQARWHYVQYLALHAHLPREISGAALAQAAAPPEPKPRPAPPAPLSWRTQAVRYVNQPLVFSLIFAAVFLWATLSTLMMFHVTEPAAPVAQRAAPSAPPIATLRGQRDVAWKGLAPGGRLTVGQLLELRSGTVEVTLDNGVRLLAQGPCRAAILSPKLVELREGRLTVRVPKAAVGYAVQTPTALVVDLGTEFGVQVERDGAAAIDVLEGQVLVRGRDTNAPDIKLLAGESARVTAGANALVERSAPLGGFVRALPADAPPQDAPVAQDAELQAHWSFAHLADESPLDGLQVRDLSRFGRHARIHGAPHLVAGPEEYGGGTALRFAAERQAVVFACPQRVGGSARDLNFAEDDSFTLEAIIRLAPEPAPIGSLVAKDYTGNQPSWWLRVNQGVLEAAVEDFDLPNERIGLARGLERLDNGRWHHVALVRDARSRQLRLYVDHRLDATANDHTQNSQANDRDLVIGAFNAPGRQFLGDIATVRITGKSLAPAEFLQPKPSEAR